MTFANANATMSRQSMYADDLTPWSSGGYASTVTRRIRLRSWRSILKDKWCFRINTDKPAPILFAPRTKARKRRILVSELEQKIGS